MNQETRSESVAGGRRRRLAAGLLTAVLVAAGLTVLAPAASAAVTTVSKDLLRTGWYPDQAGLSPDLVAGGSFGQQFSVAVDGQVYAQPLVSNSTLLVATENNNAYGLDPATGAQRWTRNFGTPWNPYDLSCADLTPTIGITGTPVVDETTNTEYLFSKTYASGTSGTAAWYLHALDVTTGAERAGFPVLISGHAQNVAAQVFNPTTQMQRPGLLLMNGVVYAGFGSHCDAYPYDGWVVGVSTAGRITSMWVDESATGGGGGIWQAGSGLVSDGPGQIIVSTGNGNLPAVGQPGKTPPADLGQAVVRLTVQSDGTLKATDHFIPYDGPQLNTWDADLGSGGPTGLPDSFGTTTHPHLMVEAGKEGYLYLLDRDNLGGQAQGPSGGDAVVGRFGPDGGVWGKAAAWPGDGGYIYVTTASAGSTNYGTAGQLHAYKYGRDGTGQPTLSLVGRSSDAYGLSSGPPVVTSDGVTSGSALVWDIYAPDGTGKGAQLRAYQPVPVNGAMVQVGSWPIGMASKFSQPAVDGNKVYVGTRDGHVLRFGSPVTVPMSSSAITWGATTIGQSQVKVATLTANLPLTVTAVSTSSADFVAGAPSPALPATMSTGQTMTVPITFTPSVAGQESAALTVTTSVGTVKVSLNGTGQSSTAKIVSSPPAISFGGVPVGQSATGSATFSNVGAQPLTITAITLPSAPFTVAGLPAVGSTLAAGDSFTVTATFAPTTVGTFTDDLTIGTSAGAADMPMSGSAAQAAKMVISPAGIDLGKVPVGSATSGSFTVSNTGGSPMTITKSKPPIAGTGITATSALPEGTSIGPGQSVTETVQFAPTATGAVSDTWVLTATDGSGVQNVTLSGTAVQAGSIPAPAASGWSLNGTATMVGTTLQLTDATTANSAGTAFFSTPVDSSYLDISFDANIDGGSGADGLTLALADPSAGATPTSIGVGGGGLGWAKIPGIAVALDTYANAVNPSNNFVGLATGYSAANNDNLVWAATSTAIPPLRGVTRHVRVVVANSVLTVSIDGTTVLTNAVQLAPTTMVGFTGGDGGLTDRHAVSNVVIKTIAGTAPVAPSTPTAVAATPGDRAATVSWTAPAADGGTPITGYVVTASPGGRQATVTGTPPATSTTVTGLTNGTAYTFTVTASNSAGSSAASAASNPTTPTAQTGTVTVTPAALDLGTAPIGFPVVKSFTVTNPGNSPVTITGSTPPGGAFTATTTLPPGTVLPAEQSLTETVRFTPTAVGAVSDSWVITGSDGSSKTVPLTGTGAKPLTPPDPSAGGWTRNGTAVISGTALQLTDATSQYVAGSAFYPTAVDSRYLDIAFDATIGGGSGADGLTLALADPASTTPTAIGVEGGGLGWSGIKGVAVALDTYANGTDPSGNFVGVATGADPQNPGNLVWAATATAIPDLRAATRHIHVVVSGGMMTVSVDGTPVITTAVLLTPTTLIGFTAGSGGKTDGHAVSGVKITTIAPVTVPAAPTAVAAVPHDGSAAVSWTAPTADGGSAITGYTVVAAPGGATVKVGAAARTATVTGLTNGIAYRFTVLATNAVGNSAPSAASAAVTPLAPTPVPIGVYVSEATVPEPLTGTATLTFRVALSAAAAGPVTVGYRTADSTAKAGLDYTATSGTLSFAAGETSKTVAVTVLGRAWHGSTALSMQLQLISATGGPAIIDPAANGRILATRGPISISATDVVVQQGSTATSAVFALTLSAAPGAGESVTVGIATADGTARSGVDYTALTARSITFNPGIRTLSVSVPVAAGVPLIANRTFRLVLSAPSANATLARAAITATLRRSGSALVPTGVYVGDSALVRAAAGLTGTMSFTVSLSAPATVPVAVTYQTLNGAAIAGTDYTAVPATTITFSAGQVSKVVTVPIRGSGLHAIDVRDLHLRLNSATGGAALIDNDGVGRIMAPVGPIALSVQDVTVLQGAAPTQAVFTLALDGAPVSGESVWLVAWTIAGTATSPGDFTAVTSKTVTFAAGVRTMTVAVPVAASVGAKPNRTFTLRLSLGTASMVSARITATATLQSR